MRPMDFPTNRPAVRAGCSPVALGIFAIFMILAFARVSPLLTGLGGLGVAAYLFWSGLQDLRGEGQPTAAVHSFARPIPSAATAPVANTPTLHDKLETMNIPKDLKCPSCGAAIRPVDKVCRYCGSSLVPLIDLPQPAHLGETQVGQTLHIMHPAKGDLAFTIQRRLYYGELWQEHTGPTVPWTPTGAYFVGLTLDKDIFLLNWQSRFFLLESHSPLTDMEINRSFAPYARQFAASNQTADVRFTYDSSPWHIDDIGKFRIEYVDGDGAAVSPGSVGRFIHASNARNVLVVEDYQSGGSGGLDTLWRGVSLQETDIKF